MVPILQWTKHRQSPVPVQSPTGVRGSLEICLCIVNYRSWAYICYIEHFTKMWVKSDQGTNGPQTAAEKEAWHYEDLKLSGLSPPLQILLFHPSFSLFPPLMCSFHQFSLYIWIVCYSSKWAAYGWGKEPLSDWSACYSLHLQHFQWFTKSLEQTQQSPVPFVYYLMVK